jgi:hypothetical protein
VATLQSCGGKGIIKMRTTAKIGKVTGIDTKSVRSAGHSTSRVKLLDLDADELPP